MPYADPWNLLAAIALATTRVRFGPMVMPLARRRPWTVAREAVTLDHLSRGRLALGVGLRQSPLTNSLRSVKTANLNRSGRPARRGAGDQARCWTGGDFHFNGRALPAR